MKLLIISILIFISTGVNAQDGELINSDFHFTEGIYLTFEEFKTNSPSIENFTIKNYGEGTFFEFPCTDSTGNIQTCTAENVWGYCKGKNVYINQGYGAVFFRLQVIGALIHYYSVSTYYQRDYNYDYYGRPYPSSSRRVAEEEMVMEWESGNSFAFNYRSFSTYLEMKDQDLYTELGNSKKKRKMIYFYLLKYNENHPVYIKNKDL